MIPSIQCYMPPSVELLEPTIPQFSNQGSRPQFSNQITACHYTERVVATILMSCTVILCIFFHA